MDVSMTVAVYKLSKQESRSFWNKYDLILLVIEQTHIATIKIKYFNSSDFPHVIQKISVVACKNELL